jgi:hypothetical protein
MFADRKSQALILRAAPTLKWSGSSDCGVKGNI